MGIAIKSKLQIILGRGGQPSDRPLLGGTAVGHVCIWQVGFAGQNDLLQSTVEEFVEMRHQGNALWDIIDLLLLGGTKEFCPRPLIIVDGSHSKPHKHHQFAFGGHRKPIDHSHQMLQFRVGMSVGRGIQRHSLPPSHLQTSPTVPGGSQASGTLALSPSFQYYSPIENHKRSSIFHSLRSQHPSDPPPLPSGGTRVSSGLNFHMGTQRDSRLHFQTPVGLSSVWSHRFLKDLPKRVDC